MISVILEEFKTYFSYANIAKTRWRELIQEAKKKFNIWFDLENNDPVKGKTRELKFYDADMDMYTRFRCQLCSAGGDWEYPVYYFKCQLYKGYAKGVGQYSNSLLVFIPGINQGNGHLLPIDSGRNKGGWRAPHDDGEEQPEKRGVERNETKAWKSLNTYLQGLVDAHAAERRNNNNNNGKPVSKSMEK